MGLLDLFRDKPAVLLIDDDAALLADYTRKLDAMGFAVFAAASAEEGLATVERVKVSLILLDHVLPGISGLRAITEFARRSAAPIVIMTAHFDDEVEKDAKAMGAARCVKKPLDFEIIGAVLQATLSRKA